jgi:hypothetical protein
MIRLRDLHHRVLGNRGLQTICFECDLLAGNLVHVLCAWLSYCLVYYHTLFAATFGSDAWVEAT